MLFDPTKTFCFFYIYFIANVLCCFGIKAEKIQLTEPLKNFHVSKALVVAAEKYRQTFPITGLHILDSWLNICVYFTRR